MSYRTVGVTIIAWAWFAALIACSEPKEAVYRDGHWTPDSSGIQSFYADDDGHEIGWIDDRFQAQCMHGTNDSSFDHALDYYEGLEDAQKAVEKRCFRGMHNPN